MGHTVKLNECEYGMVLLAPLVCQFPHLLKKVHGGGFPGLLGRLCERMEGQCFDQVRGNYSWVQTRLCFLKESFHMALTRLGRLMVHRGEPCP